MFAFIFLRLGGPAAEDRPAFQKTLGIHGDAVANSLCLCFVLEFSLSEVGNPKFQVASPVVFLLSFSFYFTICAFLSTVVRDLHFCNNVSL